MSEPTVEEVVSLVSSKFEVSEFNRSLDTLEFKIEDSQFKSKFVELAHELEAKDFACKLESLPEGLFLYVKRFPPKKQRRWLSSTWTPRILFGVVITFVMIDGYFRTSAANTLINIGDPLEMAGIYTLSLLGIL